jgi:MFS family permease
MIANDHLPQFSQIYNTALPPTTFILFIHFFWFMKGEGDVEMKSDSVLRWLILVCNCVVMIGVYYTFDMPAALKTQMESYMGSPDNFETYFSLLYTIPAFPNIILPFFGGYFVDTLGAYKCMVAFISIIATGHVVFAFGLSIKSWPIMFLGRAIFGIGETSNSVANSTILADWFGGGGELALAFGLNLSISRLSSVVNNLVSPILASSAGVVFALWFGAILLACSVGAAVLMFPINKAVEIRIQKALQGDSKDLLKSQDRTASVQEDFKFTDALKFPLSFRILTLMCLLIYGKEYHLSSLSLYLSNILSRCHLTF